MQQQTQHILEKVVLENSNNTYSLSTQMIQLEVVQQAVARLMDRIDEITYKGWHKEHGMACVSILEIQDTVRLIDMAFFPLFKEMSKEVKTIKIYAQELHDAVVKSESEQSSKVTTHEIISQSV